MKHKTIQQLRGMGEQIQGGNEMSEELKVIKIELNSHGKPIASIQGTTSYYGISPNDTFYPQAEADKVIAHHKRKRCLAMADMNWWQANRYSAAEMVERIRGNFEEAMQCSKLEKNI